MEEFFFYNIIYFLFAFFLIYPPQEVQSIGLTLPVLFSSWLGSEQLCFVHYHIVRISLTLVVHSLLPLGYYLFVGFNLPHLNLFSLTHTSSWWQAYLTCSVMIAVTFSTLVYYWYNKIEIRFS